MVWIITLVFCIACLCVGIVTRNVKIAKLEEELALTRQKYIDTFPKFT